MSGRGFVASGVLPPGEIAEMAARAEERRYSTFWITVLAGKTDPLTVLAAALDATRQIEVGLGLVPLSAFGGGDTAQAIVDRDLERRRIIVALGVGNLRHRPAELWAREACSFKSAAPDVRLAVGSYGRRVLQAGGRVADAVLLNWMTPERMRWAIRWVDDAAHAAGRPPARPVFVYVAAAADPGGAERIGAALTAMRTHPYHRRHQDAMAATGPVGVVAGNADEVTAGLSRYAGAIPIVNPIGDLDSRARLKLLERFAPEGPFPR